MRDDTLLSAILTVGIVQFSRRNKAGYEKARNSEYNQGNNSSFNFHVLCLPCAANERAEAYQSLMANLSVKLTEA